MLGNANNIKSRNKANASPPPLGNASGPPSGNNATISAPNAVSVRTTPNSVLGSGGFGCVLAPPLPNSNEAGNPVNLPGEVMKVFFRDGDADKAVSNAEKIQRINNANAPLFSYPIKKYRAPYTKRNIPEALRAKCKIEAANNLNVPIHAVHMPNLGVSFADIDAAAREAIKALPMQTLLNGFKNLFNTVKKLNSGGHIHRDIKPPNIMIEPATGRMMIIDFDLMASVRVLIGTPQPAQWNSPPETVFWNVRNAFSIEPTIDPAVNPEEAAFQADMQEYAADEVKYNIVQRVRIYSLSASILPAYRDTDAFLASLGWFNDWFVAAKDMKNPDGTPFLNTESRMQMYFKMLSKDTFDSFCVAFSIMYFLDKVFPGYHTIAGPLKNVYDAILVPMVDFNPQTRMRVEPALVQIDTIIATHVVGGMLRRARKNKTRRAKKSKRGATRASASRR